MKRVFVKGGGGGVCVAGGVKGWVEGGGVVGLQAGRWCP